MAWSSLQEGLEFFDLNGGFVAFSRFRHPLLALRGLAIALGDPIAAPETHARIADAFLSREQSTIFVQISRQFAEVLSQRGLLVNQCGTETEIPLASFSLAGKAKAQVRHWLNKARSEGVSVEERAGADLPLAEMREVSTEWLGTRGHRELFLLTRPMVFRAEEYVRTFLARRSGRLEAFAVFDPMFRDGRIIGYYHNHDRFRRDAPTGTSDLITITAAEVFRCEGREVLSLGYSPLAGLGAEPFPHNRLTRLAFQWIYAHGNRLYPFRNNAFHKSRYDGRTLPVFAASPRGMTLRDFACVLKCTGAI